MGFGFVSGRGGRPAGQGAPYMAINGVTRVEIKGVTGIWTGPNQGPQFNSRSQQFLGSFSIAGVTRNSAGVALGNCAVHLFQTGSDRELDETVSDGSGNFSFVIGFNSGNFYLVAYKPGSPDVAGTSINTLVAI